MNAAGNRNRIGKLVSAVLALTSLLLAAPVLAQGDLYGDQAPAGAAWIRIINVATDEPLSASLDGTGLAAEYGHASGYVPADAGTHALSHADSVIELSSDPGMFLTVAFLPDGPVVIEDPALRDISRGLLGLMNLTSRADLALVTDDGDVVVQAVGPMEAESIQVSAAVTALQVMHEGVVIAVLDEHSFERGSAYTVVVFDGEAGPAAVLVTASGTD